MIGHVTVTGDNLEEVNIRKQSRAYLDLLEEMAVLHVKKSMGYSGESQDVWANFRSAEELGVPAYKGVLIRWLDKVARIKNLVANPANDVLEDESLEDTLMDAASYALIALSLLHEAKGDTLTGSPTDAEAWVSTWGRDPS
jgi:hypothetical protein